MTLTSTDPTLGERYAQAVVAAHHAEACEAMARWCCRESLARWWDVQAAELRHDNARLLVKRLEQIMEM